MLHYNPRTVGALLALPGHSGGFGSEGLHLFPRALCLARTPALGPTPRPTGGVLWSRFPRPRSLLGPGVAAAPGLLRSGLLRLCRTVHLCSCPDLHKLPKSRVRAVDFRARASSKVNGSQYPLGLQGSLIKMDEGEFY